MKKTVWTLLAVTLAVALGALALNGMNEARGVASRAETHHPMSNPERSRQEDRVGDVPEGLPLAVSYPRLQRLASRGDRVAASRLFDDLRTCLRADYLGAVYQNLSKDKDWLTSDAVRLNNDGEVIRESLAQRIAQVEDDMARINGATTLCAGLPNFNDGRIYDVALQAAALGDDQATACLLQATYPSPPVDPVSGESYRERVASYAEKGLRHGSWEVAKALSIAYGGRSVGGYSSYVVEANNEKLLRIKLLIRKGTPDGSPESFQLDRQIAAINQSVTDEERTSAQSWAEDTYHNSYFMNGPVSPYTVACGL